MSARNETNRQRDGNWGEIHDRLSAADAATMARLNAAIRREPATCRRCGSEIQARPGTRGYCWRRECQNERQRMDAKIAREREAAHEA